MASFSLDEIRVAVDDLRFKETNKAHHLWCSRMISPKEALPDSGVWMQMQKIYKVSVEETALFAGKRLFT